MSNLYPEDLSNLDRWDGVGTRMNQATAESILDQTRRNREQETVREQLNTGNIEHPALPEPVQSWGPIPRSSEWPTTGVVATGVLGLALVVACIAILACARILGAL